MTDSTVISNSTPATGQVMLKPGLAGPRIVLSWIPVAS